MARDTRASMRLTMAGRTAIEDAALKRGVSLSEQLRIMVAYAARHMPEGWKP